MASKLWPSAILLSVVLAGCQSEASKQCEELFKGAQKVVTEVDSASVESVQKSVDAVQAGVDACVKAERYRERDELTKARNQLRGHLEYIKTAVSGKQREKLTPEQLAELVKKGDPGCPKGQAYKHRDSGEEVRCTGAQPMSMPWAAAKEYFERRGYKIHVEGATLKAEYGSEVYVFAYDKAESTEPATCFTLHAPPGWSWQEAVSRVSGTPPDKLDRDKPALKSSGGKLPYAVEEADGSVTVKIGACG